MKGVNMPLSSDVEKYQEQMNKLRQEQRYRDLTILLWVQGLAIVIPIIIVIAYILLR